MRHPFPQWRLKFVSFAATIIVCILLARIIQIQIIRHDIYNEKAKKQWYRKIPWHARRGSIFDRNGIPLAVTHRTYSIGVTPRRFAGNGSDAVSVAGILGITVKQLGRKLDEDRQYVPLGRNLRLSEDEVEVVSRIPGVRLDRKEDRLYPFKAIPPRLVGRLNFGGEAVGGVELALNDILKGKDGWLLVNKDARDTTFFPVNGPGKKPDDGSDLFLSIDSRVQSIIDFELDQAVERYRAVGGVVIVIDPSNGDILGLSEKFPAVPAGGNRHPSGNSLFSVSCIFEPGSTFKLITDLYLLDRGTVDPYDVFYAENGKASFDFGTFRDHNKYEWLTFKESFVLSSNIATIKAVKDSDWDDFYRFILKFGFGTRTGIDLPAESRGTLRPPGKWSGRSLPSISIGHEIGVTALQMALAYCCLANGGDLFVPRLVLAARDEGESMRELNPPVRLRRVFSRETAETLKGFCREVVVKGTGKKASVSGIAVAGKTGTAEKAGENGYIEGKYVTSFIGYAPADEPRFVCLVLLDEPAYPYYWGGESSAVVFRKIVEGINLATELLCREDDLDVAFRYRKTDRIAVPCFLRMTSAEAVRLASACGLYLCGSSGDGTVYAQIPDPGTLLERGGECKLLYGPKERSEKTVHVPDLRKLSIREARRLLIACGLKSRITGFGLVRSQKPRPGTVVHCGHEITLTCRPGCKVSKPTRLALKGGDGQ